MTTCRHAYQEKIERCPVCDPDAIYEINQTQWLAKGEPIVEILRNGNAWTEPWDSHFRFGRIKTKMILSCIHYIEEFAVSASPAELIKAYIIQKPDPDLIIQMQTFPEFVNSHGYLIPYPFLRLDRLVNKDKTQHIGFGQVKASALVILKDDLAVWLQSVHGWY